jgi:hypothetical protein
MAPYNEIQPIPVRVFSRRNETSDIERFEFSSHCSRLECVIQTHGKNHEQRADLDDRRQTSKDDRRRNTLFLLRLPNVGEHSVVAEEVGFEPTVPLRARRFSRPVP